MKALTGLPPQAYVEVSEEANISLAALLALVEALEHNLTPAYLARYRPDVGADLSEEQIQQIQGRLRALADLSDRRVTILSALTQQNRLTPQLREQIENTLDRRELEDLYLPYKPKRRSAADEAVERGLEPLARYLWAQEPPDADVEAEATRHLQPERGLPDAASALAGARAIVARWLGENAEVRSHLRRIAQAESRLIVRPSEEGRRPATRDEHLRRRLEPLQRFEGKTSEAPWRQVLAIRRGVREGLLTFEIALPEELCLEYLRQRLLRHPESGFNPHLEAAAAEAFREHLMAALESEVRQALDERVDAEAIELYQRNLRKILMAPPAGRIPVLSLETGRPGGWRAAVTGVDGELAAAAIVRPDPLEGAQADGSGGGKTDPEDGPREAEASEAATGAAQSDEPQRDEPVAEISVEAAAQEPRAEQPTTSEAADAQPSPASDTAAPAAEPQTEQPSVEVAEAQDAPAADAAAPAAEMPAEEPPFEGAEAQPAPATDAAAPAAEPPAEQPPVEVADAQHAPAADAAAPAAEPPAEQPPVEGAEAQPAPAGNAAAPAAELPAEQPPVEVADAQNARAADAAAPAAEMPAEEPPVEGAEAQPAPAGNAAAPAAEPPAEQPPVEAVEAQPAPAPDIPAPAAEPQPDAPDSEAVQARQEARASQRPTQPRLESRRRAERASTPHADLADLLRDHSVELVVIGNGPGVRQVERFVRLAVRKSGRTIAWVAVNEAGSWIYATSKEARREMPNVEPPVRSAACLARRAQDPLAELVKLDPRILGIGQGHHEVDQKRLRTALRQTAELCAHEVGIDVNTASEELLATAPGLTDRLARRIVEQRRRNGRFQTLKAVAEIPGLSGRIYEQAAGFLRVFDGEEPLDATGVHPAHYAKARQLCEAAGVTVEQALENPQALDSVELENLADKERPLPVLQAIVREFRADVRNPRGRFEAPEPAADVQPIEEPRPGLKVEGVVTNVTSFGAFVDIGAEQDGLVHVSQLSEKFVQDPQTAVKPGERVTVWVTAVERGGQRISLTMREPRETSRQRRASPEARRSADTRRPSNGSRQRDREPVRRTFGPEKRERREEQQLSDLSMEEKLSMLKGKFRTKVEKADS